MAEIRLATAGDLGAVCAIYEAARTFMQTHGNPTQWPGDYPGLVDAEKDLAAGALWVLDEGSGPVAVMSVLPGPDPTYGVIEGEPWLNDDPYWVMHRLAVAESGRGAGTRMLSWLCARHDNVRADTHADNVPMRRTLEKCGFVRRGTIWVEDGTPRVAYHFVRHA
ncbi:N-acetyltransferase [Olsenella uli]|uniref:GNAT family N-acetyltransferase n=1 Tax=Olsenella uli TaxID=133926 RepID=UPI00195A8591|nr:GNAT family N-acetyltransferase [Olsenella uli]MBM6675214.1 N-acetyltransferase [Olsenella uli]